MFGHRHFGARYWGPRYWGPAVDTGGGPPEPPAQDTSVEGFGELVSVPGVEVFEDFGILGPVYADAGTLRIEYTRRGLPLSSSQGFEIPDRYAKYTRWYALWQALKREGDGQDLELAEHYKQRWMAGIERLNRRKQVLQVQRKSIMGQGTPSEASRSRLVRLPHQYGKVVR
jgi:hypothetical protein